MAGVPYKPIDWNQLDLYLEAGLSQIKIAEEFGIDRDTLRDRVKQHYGVEYSAYSASKHSRGENLLQVVQYQKALKGNVQMLIYLGKVRLKQRELTPLDTIPILQDDIDKDHLIMQLQNKIDELQSLNENKSQTE